MTEIPQAQQDSEVVTFVVDYTINTLPVKDPPSMGAARQELVADLDLLRYQRSHYDGAAGAMHAVRRSRRTSSREAIEPPTPWKGTLGCKNDLFDRLTDTSPSMCYVKNHFLTGMFDCSSLSPPHKDKGPIWTHPSRRRSAFSRVAYLDPTPDWQSLVKYYHTFLFARSAFLKRGISRRSSTTHYGLEFFHKMQSQTLPQKDQSLFKQLVKFYESKQYKKGIKSADAILKKYPDHGETLCMKGLLLHCSDKKEEGFDLAKRGLKFNLKSHVCWHVLGLIYRADRNYTESSKCYKSALRMDAGNVQIMRDLCLLQLSQRDLAGYSETKRQLLLAKPGQRQSWIAYAVAEHLRGSTEAALDVLKKMDDSFGAADSSSEPLGRYEQSELALYRVSLLLESGKHEGALIALAEKDAEIVDKVTKFEFETYLHFIRKDFVQAKRSLQFLIGINPAHEGYLLVVLAVSGVLSEVTHEQVREWLRLGDSGYSLSRDWIACEDEIEVVVGNRTRRVSPHCTALVMKGIAKCGDLVDTLVKVREEFGIDQKNDTFALLELFLLPEGSELVSKLTTYLEKKFAKGVPSAFKAARNLYFQSPSKGKILHETIESLVEKSTDPTSKTFALFCSAQCLDFTGDYASALTRIEECFTVTPTLLDAYVLKSKILKHMGKLDESSECLETVRKLDLADRYLNSKSVKALLRIGEIEKATETVHLFAKEISTGKSNLNEMQCMWWSVELGKAYIAKGETAKALTSFAEIKKFISDMTEDEFDFNYYCLRKMTLRAYIEFLKLEDRLASHKSFKTMAELIIPILSDIALGTKVLKPETTEGAMQWHDPKVALAEAVSIVNELNKRAASWPGTHRLTEIVAKSKQQE